jgi:subtilisin family serine protease
MWAMENTGQLGGTVGADIKATLAWNITTGGLTSTGDTIIVAVIDGGFYLPHNDLSFWKNYAEIPGDTIDNDNNGYIDDYNGWNAYNDSPLNSSNNTHGTHVAGTVGAKGNNVIGVTGVNWNVKIMPVAGSSDVESVVVRAYNYVLKQRKIYNQTNGMSGAFVVSTNASFGKDYGQPANYPIWCAIYDSLGKQGILSAAATANLNINVDVQGDIPTTCPSDYLIAVTNTTRTDLKYSSAAYGVNSIDLGAPGTSIYSTYPTNSYSTSTGTSMASPHVAGAIALMISAASPQQIAEYKLKPDSMALVFKQMLLCGVDVKSDLTGKTVTGGRLNLYNAVLNVVNNDVCVTANTVAPIKNANKLSLYSLYPNPLINSNTVNITYYAPQTNLKIQIYNQLGQLIHTLILQPSSWGFKSHLIDLPNLESGIYWIKLVKNNDAETSNTLPVVIIK